MSENYNINEIIKKRKSIRRYDPNGVVSKRQIELLLEAAMLAPSAVNSRPWEFIVIEGRQKMDSVAIAHPYAQMMKTASCAIIITANPDALKGTKIDGMQMWQHDCGAAAQNILLQAAHMNLGTCWCGIHPNEGRMAEFRSMFDIADNRVPFCIIAVGAAQEEFGSRGFYQEDKIKWIK